MRSSEGENIEKYFRLAFSLNACLRKFSTDIDLNRYGTVKDTIEFVGLPGGQNQCDIRIQ